MGDTISFTLLDQGGAALATNQAVVNITTGRIRPDVAGGSIDDTTSVLAYSTRDDAQNEEWVDAVVVKCEAPSGFP